MRGLGSLLRGLLRDGGAKLLERVETVGSVSIHRRGVRAVGLYFDSSFVF
jgi:hypothetical protein